MLRKICIVCLLFLMSLTIGCSQTESTVSKESAVQGKSHESVVPSEYNHAKSMLDSLKNQGINIQEVKNSNSMAMFKTEPNYAMSIKTNMGFIDLIHLRNKNGKEFAVQKKEAADGRFKYMIMKNNEKQEIYDANAETYFHISDEYIAITRVKELDEKIKKLFESR